MPFLNNGILYILCHARKCTTLIHLTGKRFITFLPAFNPRKNFFMVSQLCRQLSFLHISVKIAVTKCKIFHRTVTTCTSRNSMLYVVFRIVAQEVSYTDFGTSIQTFVALLLPKLKFFNVRFGRFNVVSRLAEVQVLNGISIRLMLLILCPLVIGNGLTHVCIVQTTGIFYMYLCILVDYLLFQQLVYNLSYFMKRPHGHRVTYGIGSRRAELVNASLLFCILIGFYH